MGADVSKVEELKLPSAEPDPEADVDGSESVSVVAVTVAQAQLPAGWERLMDPVTGQHYYCNRATGQSQWDPPVQDVQSQVQDDSTRDIDNMRSSRKTDRRRR